MFLLFLVPLLTLFVGWLITTCRIKYICISHYKAWSMMIWQYPFTVKTVLVILILKIPKKCNSILSSLSIIYLNFMFDISRKPNTHSPPDTDTIPAYSMLQG